MGVSAEGAWKTTLRQVTDSPARRWTLFCGARATLARELALLCSVIAAVCLGALLAAGSLHYVLMLKRRTRVRCIFLQWDFRLGSAAGAGKASGPLGGVGSGPQVEKMVEAMDSWNGLCLDYRCSVFIVAGISRPILKRLDKSSRLVGCSLFLSGLFKIVASV